MHVLVLLVLIFVIILFGYITVGNNKRRKKIITAEKSQGKKVVLDSTLEPTLVQTEMTIKYEDDNLEEEGIFLV